MEKHEFIGRLTRYNRLQNTYYGTPRYEIFMESENTGELFHAKTSQRTGHIYGFNSEVGAMYRILYHNVTNGNISIDDIYKMEG